jgi:uncharacterized protein
MKNEDTSSRPLDIVQMAQHGSTLSGEFQLLDCERLLMDADHSLPDLALCKVKWTLRGEQRQRSGEEPQVWLHVQAQATVPLPCQGCLETMEVLLHVNHALRFVATEEEAQALDADAEEDVLALEPAPELHALIEDELILELPLMLAHPHCPHPLAADWDATSIQEPQADEKPNPFAVLASIKKH